MSAIIIQHNPDPRKMVAEILRSIPCLEYWSDDALRKLYKGAFLLVRDHIHALEREGIKVKKSSFSRRMGQVLRSRVPQPIRSIFEEILSVEKLSVLHGYGLSNRFGDQLYGNPEKQSIVEILPSPQRTYHSKKGSK